MTDDKAMETPSNLEETFFDLKTLTLRRGEEILPPDVTPVNRQNSVNTNSSQQRMIAMSSSNSLLELTKRTLFGYWRVLLVGLVVFLNLLVVAILYTNLNHRLDTRIDELQKMMVENQKMVNNQRMDGNHNTGTNKLTSTLASVMNEKSMKHIFLSLSSQQSELNNVRDDVKTNSEKLTSLEKKMKAAHSSSDMIFESVIKEANISLCSSHGGKLVAPMDGVYRLELTAKVHGNTYINRKMFEIMKNSQILRNGGSIRIRYSGKENRTVDCSSLSRGTKSCYYMDEILLVYMKTGDYLQVENKFVEESGEVFDLSFCIRTTEYDKVPGGADSLVITH